VQIADYSSYHFAVRAEQGDYLPICRSGSVGLKCCVGASKGNVDGSADELVTIGDLTVLIDYLFISFTPLWCWEEADVDGSGGLVPVDMDVTIGDMTVLIDHLYISLSPLPACP